MLADRACAAYWYSPSLNGWPARPRCCRPRRSFPAKLSREPLRPPAVEAARPRCRSASRSSRAARRPVRSTRRGVPFRVQAQVRNSSTVRPSILKGGVTSVTQFHADAFGASTERVTCPSRSASTSPAEPTTGPPRPLTSTRPSRMPTRSPPSSSLASYSGPEMAHVTGRRVEHESRGVRCSVLPRIHVDRALGHRGVLEAVERKLRPGVEPHVHAAREIERGAAVSAGPDRSSRRDGVAGDDVRPLAATRLDLHVAHDARNGRNGHRFRKIERPCHPGTHRGDGDPGGCGPAREAAAAAAVRTQCCAIPLRRLRARRLRPAARVGCARRHSSAIERCRARPGRPSYVARSSGPSPRLQASRPASTSCAAAPNTDSSPSRNATRARASSDCVAVWPIPSSRRFLRPTFPRRISSRVHRHTGSAAGRAPSAPAAFSRRRRSASAGRRTPVPRSHRPRP